MQETPDKKDGGGGGRGAGNYPKCNKNVEKMTDSESITMLSKTSLLNKKIYLSLVLYKKK